jgi:ribosomal protein S18 acetylase RimI-like enzyme
VTDIDFRAASEADIPLLIRLVRALADEDGSTTFDPDRTQAAIHQLLADPSLGEAWIIERGGDVAGYLVITWGFSLEFHGRDAFVDELYLLPALRGQGIGRLAIEHAAERCRTRGIGAVHLEVDPENERAISLYRRSGFVQRGYRLMSRRLTS